MCRKSELNPDGTYWVHVSRMVAEEAVSADKGLGIIKEYVGTNT